MSGEFGQLNAGKGVAFTRVRLAKLDCSGLDFLVRFD